MIKHIVMFKLRECKIPGENINNARQLKKMLDDLVNHIPELKSMEVGINVSSRPTAYDLVLVSEFLNEADLGTYRVHPRHVKVIEFVKQVSETSVVVDYEF
ncbi:MAG: Dabb family protein [Bacteroidales bacterium]|nr:Dabb family protein [Bacteroidales bacterium]